jgi:Uma2 family endonuclease
VAKVSAPREETEAEQRLVLHTVEWEEYRAIAAALGERRVRLTYDGENLELMAVSRLREKLSRLLGRLVIALTEELGKPIDSAGSATLERPDTGRALEADECFYLGNEPAMRARDQIDLTKDPPPDLAIDVDITRDSLSRLGIYAALGVVEVWRFTGDRLHVYHLSAAGRYDEANRSQHFPGLPPAEIVAVMQRRTQMDENSLVRSFREWVRQQIATNWQRPA